MWNWLASLLGRYNTPHRSNGDVAHPAPQQSSTPILVPIGREQPKPELDDGAIIDFINPAGEQVAYDCGHTDFGYFEMSVYGNVCTPKGEMPRHLCRQCSREAVRHNQRCSQCGSPISIGDPIVLYPEANPLRTWHAAYVEINGHRQYLGCLDWDCCPSGGLLAGHLTRDGARFLFGGESAVAHTLKTGVAVHIDL